MSAWRAVWLAMVCATTGCRGIAFGPQDAGSDGDGGANDGGGALDASTPADGGVILRDAGPGSPPWDGGVPAWAQQLGVFEWREIQNSAMANQVPSHVALQLDGTAAVVGPNARMSAWCGLSIDTRSSTVWSLANGGHGDYYGNEVVRFDLLRDAPTWVEWFAGSSGKVVDATTGPTDPSHAHYQDGLPVSTHSYYGQQFIERQGRAIRLGGSTAPVGSAFENVEGFDVSVAQSTNGWDPAGTFGFALGGVNGGWTPAIGWSACKDPDTDDVYALSYPKVHRFRPASTGVGGTWAEVGPMPDALNSGALGATAVDTKRHRLVWLKGYGPSAPYSFDLTTSQWSPHDYPDTPSRVDFLTLGYSVGMVYVPALDAFLVRGRAAGGHVFRVDAATFAVTELATSHGDAVPAGAANSSSAEENVYTRWLFVPQLQGVVYFPKADSNAWFLRLY